MGSDERLVRFLSGGGAKDGMACFKLARSRAGERERERAAAACVELFCAYSVREGCGADLAFMTPRQYRTEGVVVTGIPRHAIPHKQSGNRRACSSSRPVGLVVAELLVALSPALGGVLASNEARGRLLPVHHSGQRLLEHILAHSLLRFRGDGIERPNLIGAAAAPPPERGLTSRLNSPQDAAKKLTSPSTTRLTAGRPRPARVSLQIVPEKNGWQAKRRAVAQEAAAQRNDSARRARTKREPPSPAPWPPVTAAAPAWCGLTG